MMENLPERNREEINFETALKRLEEITARLEGENESLESALKLYEEAIGLVRLCNEKLESAERQIRILKTSPDGEVIEEDFPHKGDEQKGE